MALKREGAIRREHLSLMVRLGLALGILRTNVESLRPIAHTDECLVEADADIGAPRPRTRAETRGTY